MVKKQAKDLKKGDKISIGGESLIVENIEISGIGKQGTQKTRITASKANGEKVVIIRPSEYPMDVS
ncbi:MAG: hypothetical protein WC796_01015 [Candidatus Pacearchaeota archaeon]|jgi:translation elongation factor P/translation initiation factor 5A